MTRKEWQKSQLALIKAGEAPLLRCTMATPSRLTHGLCEGDIPADRIARGQDTCSPECQADKRRIKREYAAMKKCRHCGHGLSKKQRAELVARGANPSLLDSVATFRNPENEENES